MLTLNKRIIDHKLKNYYKVEDKTKAAELIRTLPQIIQFFLKDIPDDIHLKKPSKENQELYNLLQKLPSYWLINKEIMRSQLLRTIENTESEDTLFEAYKSIIL